MDVSDEAGEQLILTATSPLPFDIAELAERTVVLSSLSKSHAAPGFRSG